MQNEKVFIGAALCGNRVFNTCHGVLGFGNGEYNFRFYNNTIIGCGAFNLDDTYDSIITTDIVIPKKGS